MILTKLTLSKQMMMKMLMTKSRPKKLTLLKKLMTSKQMMWMKSCLNC